MLQSPGNKYLETTVQTASPSKLLIMLFDGAIRFCKIAIESIKQKDYPTANANFKKTQDIIEEFIITLDRNSPVAEGLLSLYEYFLRRLVEANIKKDIAAAEEVLGYLTELRETFVQAALSASAAPQPTVGHG